MAYNPNNSNGQKTMANSAPVVLASDQSSIPVTGAVTISAALPTGANTIGAISNTAFIANAGTNLNTSALALDATFTGGTARMKITDGTNNVSVKAASTLAVATDVAQVVQLSPMNAQAATLVISATAAVSTANTATLPAAGVGLFHYIVRINIIKYASVATVGAAAPTIVTTTNMPGSLAWTTPTSLAVGTQYETDINSSAPMKSSVANTATTIVCPLTTSIIWRVNVYYYTAP